MKLNGFGTIEKSSATAPTGKRPVTSCPMKSTFSSRLKFTPDTAFKKLAKD